MERSHGPLSCLFNEGQIDIPMSVEIGLMIHRLKLLAKVHFIWAATSKELVFAGDESDCLLFGFQFERLILRGSFRFVAGIYEVSQK